MTITTSAFAKALRPGLKKIWGAAYREKDQVWQSCFPTKVESTMLYEEYAGFSGLGLAPVKPEGSPVAYQDMEQGFVYRLTNVSYGLGFIITKEAREDNQYMQYAQARARALGRSMRVTKETVAANVYNNAFDSNFTFADGVELCATNHVTKAGYSFRNELSTAADLSEASLEQMLIDISDFRDDRGNLIGVKGRKLIVPKELQFEAARILKSEMQYDTANNAINAIKSGAYLPEGMVVNDFLTDTDAFFILTDIEDGMTYQERMGAEFTDDNDFDTENAKFKAFERYAFGCQDVRGIFGSPGV